MRIMLNRSTVSTLITDPLTRTIVVAIVLMTGFPLVAGVLLMWVPHPWDFFVQTYLLVLLVSVGMWLISFGRLWLALLIGTTVWALGMLAFMTLGLMACVGV